MRFAKEQWIKDVPRSRMIYPDTFVEKLRYWIWSLYTPFHPYVRDFSTAIRVVRHEGRQDFLIGTIDSSRSVRELVSYLVTQGFGNHFVAWKDTDELVSLRRPDGFQRQYHVRIFTDGEVRGHYEYTPEYRPIQHLFQTGFEDRTEEFKALLTDWIVTSPALEQQTSVE